MPGPFDRALGPEHVEGLPGNIIALLYCAPSCLPVGRDPAHPAKAGRGTFRSKENP